MTGLSHVYCCDPDTGLCSTDLTGVQAVWDDLPLCVVCEALLAACEPCKADCQFATH